MYSAQYRRCCRCSAQYENSGVSSAYVVDEHLRFIGIITLDSAMQVLSGYTTFDKSILRNVPVIDNLDTPVADIMPLSASTPFPLPVIDENKLFAVLSPRPP